MILDTIRAWTDWLANPTYGVAAQLAAGGFPYDGTDTAPAVLAAIVDETRNGPTARRRIPDTTPVLMVRLHEVATLDASVGPNVAHRDADVTLATLYAQQDVATEAGNRDCYYTLRAVERALAKFVDPSITAANTARQRNSVQILNATALQHITIFEATKDTDILGGVLVTFKVRDTAP
jgi:hypothetical protein